MPSRWHLSLGLHPRRVQLHHLHGAMSRFFDHRTDGSSDFALCPPELGAEETTRVELRVLSDDRSVVDRLVNGLLAAEADGGLLLGPRDRQRRVRLLPPSGAVALGPLSLVEAMSWGELQSSAVPVQQFTIHFLSPYFSRKGNSQLPLPLPGSVVGSLERHWAAHAPVLATVLSRDQVELVIAHLRGETAQVQLDHDRWIGFVGEVRYEVARGGSSARQSLGTLLSAARFTGVGSMVAYGFGVVDIDS